MAQFNTIKISDELHNSFTSITNEFDELKKSHEELNSDYDDFKSSIDGELKNISASVLYNIPTLIDIKSKHIEEYVYSKMEIERIERENLFKKAVLGFEILLATNIVSILAIISILAFK